MLCPTFNDVNDYDMFLPVSHTALLVDYLVEREGYSITPPRSYRPTLNGCTVNNTNYLAGVTERTLLYRGDVVVDVIGVGRGDEWDDPLLPIASAWTTLLFNYAGPASICSCYPTLTLRGLGLVQWERVLDRSFPGDTRITELQKYQARNFVFRTHADEWDSDCTGSMRACKRSWVCPLMERRFGDRGCMYVSLNARSMWDGHAKWVFGGYKPCPIICDEDNGRVCEVHNEYCACT